MTSRYTSQTFPRYGAAYRCEYTGSQQCSIIDIDDTRKYMCLPSFFFLIFPILTLVDATLFFGLGGHYCWNLTVSTNYEVDEKSENMFVLRVNATTDDSNNRYRAAL